MNHTNQDMTNRISLETRLKEFLSEDTGFGDITSNSVIEEDSVTTAEIVVKEEGVIAGLTEAAILFESLGCRIQSSLTDGAKVIPNTVVLKIKGTAKAILLAERVALNILMRMSGIATATHRAVSMAKKHQPNIRIAATRKTTPGFRYFEKKAVKIGGGDTHRLRLDDCVLIKDNHLQLLPSVEEAVRRAVNKVSFTKKIEIEVETLSQAIEAIQAGADIVMLDNMEPTEIVATLRELERKDMRDRVLVEASGGITNENLADFARTGVDILSSGSLTHSVRALDFSLNISPILHESS